jgi:hypothetical protein
MKSYETLTWEALDCATSKAQHERVIQLLEKEKELSNAMGLLQAWEIFRDGIRKQYPELLVWCPDIKAVKDALEMEVFKPLTQ